MRIISAVITAALTIALCIILNSNILLPAPLGKLLSPQHGIWQNAESADLDVSDIIKSGLLTGEADVYFDDRLVPHIFAETENDAYFIQGYIHAKYRLWQMELQTLAAAGRVSEKIGEAGLEHDREFRRLGMVYAAERSLQKMESDPEVKAACDAYTNGVNTFIKSMSEAELPVEYKLMGYFPEKWTNLKSALFLKYMSFELASHENDFELTAAKNFFSPEVFAKLFPPIQDSLDPIIPKGTSFSNPLVILKAPVDYDTISRIEAPGIVSVSKADKDNGSINWAVSGSKTLSGSPVLCNDPHLGLNLPSLWYEMQISVPGFNTYGVSFPGAPSIIIGFNDSCSWGVTNGGRDVRDYYEIKFKDDSRQEYWFDSSWIKTEFRYESIKINGKSNFIDTVAYTLFGPVMYDKSFTGKYPSHNNNYAVVWSAHQPSNELKVFMLLNRSKNYNDYLSATAHMETPGQNFVFATKTGDIAMRTAGKWPAKWKGQGDFIMPGTDSSYMWQGWIPLQETPFQYNPERGFVSSANQRPVDSSYPYYLGRVYPTPRGVIINRMLSEMNSITAEDMMRMQTDNYNIFGEWSRPIFLNNFTPLNEDERKYYDILSKWDLRNDTSSVGATVFSLLWKKLHDTIYYDEYQSAPTAIAYPLNSTTMEGLLRDTSFQFIDNIKTPVKETLPDIIRSVFNKVVPELIQIEKEGRLEWGRYKDTRVSHLADTRLSAFSRRHLSIGGGENIINATKDKHGPSWRMVVSLENETKAYGVYPGGQSGNPGSRYYDNFIDHWSADKYYSLWLMKKGDEKDSRIKGIMHFSKN